MFKFADYGRGLGRALGRVIGRILRRDDNRDSDAAPQWRRPTTSARWQQEVVPFPKDVCLVDDATDEVFQKPQEAVADAQGFPGRPRDTSILTGYVDHVAVIVGNREVFIFLNKLYFNKYLLLFLKVFHFFRNVLN